MPHISISNRKLGCIPSINLPPVVTCRKDAPCAKGCYACKGTFVFPCVKNTLWSNYREWQNNPDAYEKSVYMACQNLRFFRWHSSGDIPDAEYLEMMVRIARLRRGTRFLAFTKQFEMVNRYIETNGDLPKNLIIVFSAWGNFIPENPFNLPMSYVHLKSDEGLEHIPTNARECTGACHMCTEKKKHCWNLKHGQSVVFQQH